MARIICKNPVMLLLMILLFSITASAQQKDVAAIKKITTLKIPAEKIAGLKSFVKEFPESEYYLQAKYLLFSSYLDVNNTDSALYYANDCAETAQGMIRYNIYNSIAYELAQKKTGLDTAEVYIQRAVNGARMASPRSLGMYLDTQALVMYDLGKADSALALETEAIKGHENDPSYLSNLSVYQNAAGKLTEAIRTAAKAVLNGNTDEALDNFNKWLAEEKPDAKERDQLKSEIVNKEVDEYLKNSQKKNEEESKSNAAVFLARTGVDLKKAETWASDALKKDKKDLTLEESVSFKQNLAMVYSAEGKEKESLKEMTSVENLAAPWDFDYWYTLGKTYEKAGENKKALNAYVQGSVPFTDKKVTTPLYALAKKEGLSEDDVQALLKKREEEMSSFEPGKYKKSGAYKGKVLLAELFTGAECPPCAGADYAFEALSEYFPRNAVAILEYHVHIPGPDPMTNPDTFQRYLYYDGNFGTPTVFIEGTEKMTGGGPKSMASNRFNVYKFALDKYLNERPSAEIKGSAKWEGPKIDVNLAVRSKEKLNDQTTLHVALAEKTINYPGGNGVTKNIFVVRNLLDSAKGSPLTLKNGKADLKESFNVDEIEKNISEYLNDPTKYPSWRRGMKFSGWRERTDKINRNNLAVVAWLQNNLTKEVLQAYYIDVPADASNK